MNEITYVQSEDGEALYLNGELYDHCGKLYLYDLLMMLNIKGIAKATQIDYKLPEQPRFSYPKKLKDLK